MTENTIPLATKAVMLGCVATLQAIGVDMGPIFWAVVGAAVGMTFARPSTRVRAAIVFVCVVLACSLFGSWLSITYLHDNQLNRNAASCALAIVFHPLLNLAIESLPRLRDLGFESVGSIFRRWFGVPPGDKS